MAERDPVVSSNSNDTIGECANPSAIIRAWKTDFRSPDSSLPYPVTLFNADSASEEC